MKTLALILALTAISTFAGYQNIHTGDKGLPERLGNTEHPTFEQCLSIGVRVEPVIPPVAEGYVRQSIRLVEGDGRTGAWQCVDRLQSELDAEAAIAASNAAYQASLPVTMPTGIEAPVVVLTDTEGKGWGVVADGGDLVTYPDHASPTQARADAKAHRDRIAAIENDLNQVEAQVAETNWTEIVLTNIITTTGVWSNATQRAVMIAIKDALQADRANDNNLKIAVRNLKQAAEKLRKEVK
jgi:hypothetical protein